LYSFIAEKHYGITEKEVQEFINNCSCCKVI